MEIIREGNTVDEAIASVLTENGWTKEQVSIECIQEHKTGFFRKKKAIVKVIYLNLELEKITEFTREECKRFVQFDRDRILVMPDQSYEWYQLNPPAQTRILLDEHPVLHQLSFLPEQHLRVAEPPFEEMFEIRTSEDRKQVFVRFKDESGYSLVPVVKTSKGQFQLMFDEVRLVRNQWNEQTFIEMLKAKGIVQGFQHTAIGQWLADPDKWSDGIVAAIGKDKIDGTPTQFKLVYLERNPVHQVKADSKEKRDYYGFSPIQTAKSGDLLIEIFPPTSGVNGFDVFGQLDEAAPGADIPLLLGEGVVLSTDAKQVIATMEGLVDHKENRIAMSPLFTVNGDVGLETGSIRFAGSIFVNGSVREGMTVEATDNVHIVGSVSDSVVRAGKNVEIHGNVVMSQVLGGAQNATVLKQLYWIRQMNEHLHTSLVDRGRVMESGPKNKAVGGNQSALEQKHLFVLKWLQDGQTLVKWDVREERIQRLKGWMDRAKMAFLGRMEGAHSAERMEEWLFDEGAALELIWLKQLSDPCDVKVFNAHLSTILSTGSIQVIGKSSYISTLVAGEKVVVFEGEGFVRGGMTLAGQSILVKNLGSPSGAHTRCKVLEDDGTIGMDTGYPGVHAWIGHHRTVLNSVLKRCLLSFDHEKNTIAFGVLKEKSKK